ncbi:MAG: type II secretion system F family protein [bacterium]
MTGMGHFIMTLLAAAGAIAASVTVQRFFSPAPEDPGSLDKLAAGKSRDISAFAHLDPSRSFIDWLDVFFAKSLRLENRLEEMYMLLGRPDNNDPLKILHYKEICGVILPAVLFVMLYTPAVIVAAPVGFFLPDVMYSFRIKKRQDMILRNFPTMVDLSALVIESGLDYMTALDRIVKIAPKKTELEAEVEQTINEVQLGYSRRDAMRRFAMRTGVQEVRSFVGLIIQSDELGTSLVELLRQFAADLRFRRMNRAEQLAAQASTKMLIPLFVFIFPTVFILMLAPMIADLLAGGMPF